MRKHTAAEIGKSGHQAKNRTNRRPGKTVTLSGTCC